VAGQGIWFYDAFDPSGVPSPLITAETYYVAASGLTSTQFKTAYTPGGAAVDLFANSGSSVWLFYDTGGGGYVPDFVIVPTANSLGALNVVNAAIRRIHRIPQPFQTLLDAVAVNEVFLPDGFVGQSYSITEDFDDTAIVTLVSGSLPPGLTLTQPAPPPLSFTISGTPTLTGVYGFTLSVTRGTYLANVPYHLTIQPALDSGGAYVGGF
jgi:hypothetical protein